MDATFTNITIEPVVANDEPVADIKVEVQDDFLNKFSDEPLTDEAITEEEAKNKLKKFIDYFKSSQFEKKVNSEARKTGLPPRQIAKNAIAKAFGIVGDVLGVAVDTVNFTLNGLIDLLSSIMHKTIDIITNVVRGLCRIVTFNQTVAVTN